MAYDFNSLTKQAPEASNRDKFYTDFKDVDPSKLHQISELTEWMRTKAKGSDVREVIAQLFERTWVESIKEGNANLEVAQARGTHPNLRSRLDEADNKQKQTTTQLAQKANKDEVTNVMTPKGTLAYASLPTSGNQVGWYYYCPDGDGTHGAGNYVWNGKSWFFGGTGDEGYNLLKKDLDDIVRGNRPFAIVKDEYVNTDGEIKKTNTKWDRTDYIEINDYLLIISKSDSRFNCFFDSTKSFVSNFQLSVGENRIMVPDNAKYIICSNTSDAISELIVKLDNNVRITDLENDTEAHEIALKSRKNLIGTMPNKFYPIDYKANENITFSTKGLVPVTKNHIFYFYDENKEYVTDYALFPPLAKRTISFDKDAKYILLKIEQEYPIQVEYGETATEYEDYLLKSSDLMGRITDLENDTSIITLNKQLESFVIQSTATKARGIGSSLKPLTFIHFSDWHNVPVLWERLCDYMEEYKEYIQFALHTGDYCGNWQGNYTDAYLLKNTTNPILNCVGNHDTYTEEMKKNTQESTYKLLFNHTDNWGVTFGGGNNTMYYYKDFPDSEIRLIVLDCYYDIDNQKTWLEEKLNEAKALNYAVITSMHEVSKPIVDKIQCTFQTLDNYESAGGNQSAGSFDTIIKTFKDNGGVHIVNLCGHEHDDMFGYTSNGILNLVVECATTWNGWTGGKRIEGTKTYDCFNVFSVEKDTGIFKVVRIGDNSDHYLRAKNILSYDYANKKVLYNA